MEIRDVYGDLPILETERLILRKVTEQDIQDIYAYSSIEEVARYVTWDRHQTIADTEAFVSFIHNRYENQEIAPWGMEYKDSGKLIGTIDFVSWSPEHHCAEIGYVLSPDHWGKGIMTEAAKAIIEFGFTKMDLVRIQAKCFAENVGSARVMEKAGMTFEGILRKRMFMKGKFWDLKMYSIIKE